MTPSWVVLTVTPVAMTMGMGSRPAKPVCPDDHGDGTYLNGYYRMWNLLLHLILQLLFLCLAGVPDGGILSGQSAVTWPYSSQSKHFI